MVSLSFLSISLLATLALGAPNRPASSIHKNIPPRTGHKGSAQGLSQLRQDRQVIQEFHKTVTEDPNGVLKSWATDDICKYEGIACAKTPLGFEAIAGIDFNDFGLGGHHLSLVGLLDKLPYLGIFHASSNQFQSIPDQLGHLPYLYELDVSNNALSGPFPQGVLTAKNLLFLDLRWNNLEGPVPGAVFHMDLDVLFLNNNKFSGSIPSDIGASKASIMSLANNQFEGSIPSTLNNMNTLEEILLLGNKLSGSLPEDLGGLVKLTVFDVGRNQLSGSIPESLVNLPKLEILNVTRNHFSDSLPTEMGGMKNLGSFIASDNQLTGTVPESLCGLPKIQEINLANNNFNEDLGPACLKALKKKILHVSGNCIKNAPNQKPGCGIARVANKGTSKPLPHKRLGTKGRNPPKEKNPTKGTNTT